MAYSKQTWADGSGGGTPITAARLNHIEDGVAAADAAASAADSVTAANITDATTVGRNVLKAADAAAARTAIGAGTGSSNLALGTTSTTAAAGDHTHSTYVPTTRTVNGKALSANVTLTGADAALTGYTIGTVAEAAVAPADTVNAAIAKLEKRIADLEAAP
ncbi:hypothetical protein [Mycobacterium sp. DL440]|uniref:hypothetical protein n=1 Tax=Mycobacterium sp. DL440 TaxID=2675523 RepID=UPI0014210192|nr:hypothetical protein [Mycobacterium sp. DL440]